MTLNIKDLGKLEKDIITNSSGSFPVIVLDTGALIDIVEATRNYGLNGNGKKDKNPNYGRASVFLKYLSEKTPIVITPKTYQEMQDHGRMILNAHTTELSPKIVDFALSTMVSAQKFIDQLEARLELDQARYDAYWASKEACNGNHKKDQEGCSDTDREILSTAAFLSQCASVKDKRKKIGQILVVSPDAHIIQGTEFLKRGFGRRYSNIVPISTRH